VSPASIAFAEVLEVRLPLLKPFVTGFGTTDSRRTVLVRLVDTDGREGWGEGAALDHPFYLPDTTSSTFAVTCEWALPIALAAGPDPIRVASALRAIKGNTFARAGVEAAFWCLEAARVELSLASLLSISSCAQGGRLPLRQAVPVGESIGIHRSVEETIDEVVVRLEEGYQRIKLKIEPGWDLDLVAAVRAAVGEEVMLQVDANASYRAEPDHLDRLAALDNFGLACIEQPLGWDDLTAHALLQSRIATPICLDESIRSPEDAERAIAMGACRNVNLKPGRVGGATASLAIHDLCVREQVPLWCGGMLESGVGRSMNLALAALPGFTEPADMSPSSVLYEFDLVDPTYEVAPDGTIAVPTAAGLGFELCEDRIERQCQRRVRLDADQLRE
jgi:O-succinylbenzoate synthase